MKKKKKTKHVQFDVKIQYWDVYWMKFCECSYKV